MKFLYHILARLRRLKWHDIGILALTCATALVVSSFVALFDIYAVQQWLDQKGIVTIGFDYLLTGILGMLTACCACALTRQKGYGSSLYMLGMLFIFTGLVFSAAYLPLFSRELLFALKYNVFFLGQVCFWALASRVIPLAVRSLKFLGVLVFALLGCFLGGWIGASTHHELGIFIFVGFCLVLGLFKAIGSLVKIPKETFTKKNGSMVVSSAKTAIHAVLLLNFCVIILRALIDFSVYQTIAQEGVDPVSVISMIWMLFAGMGLLITFVMLKVRFLRANLGVLMSLILALSLVVLGSVLQENILIYCGASCFMVSEYFYMEKYFILWSKPFIVKQGIQLQRFRWLLIVPLGFIFIGALLLTEPMLYIPLTLVILGMICIVLLGVVRHCYGRQLMRLCALRVWPQGPLVLTYSALNQMIDQGLSKKPAEVIYFLRILQEGDSPVYRKRLMAALESSSISVRLFALKKLEKLSLTAPEQKIIHKLFQSDACEEVQNMALGLLIADGLESGNAKTWKKYKAYLTNKKYVFGACIGFLTGRGVWLHDVVQCVLTLSNSCKETDKINALTIMKMRPRPEWIEPITTLLNDEKHTIKKAALQAAGSLASPILLNRILSLLDKPRWRDVIWEVLDRYGKVAFPAFEKALTNEDVPLDRRREIVLFLGRLSSGEGVQILLRSLFVVNRILRPYIIDALTDSGIVWVHQDRKKLLRRAIQLNEQEWQQMKRLLDWIDHVNFPKLQKAISLLREAIQEEMARTRHIVLDLLELYSLHPLFRQAIETLKEDQWTAYPAAVGNLQDMLQKRLYQRVREILLYPQMQPEMVMDHKGDVAELLNTFLLNPPNWVTPWMKAVAIFCWRLHGGTGGLNAVRQSLKSHDWIVLETAIYTLGKLEKHRKNVEDMILSIPTHYLLKQNFQELLEEAKC